MELELFEANGGVKQTLKKWGVDMQAYLRVA